MSEKEHTEDVNARLLSMMVNNLVELQKTQQRTVNRLCITLIVCVTLLCVTLLFTNLTFDYYYEPQETVEFEQGSGSSGSITQGDINISAGE